jgi:hypothetical protein
MHQKQLLLRIKLQTIQKKMMTVEQDAQTR